MDQTQKIVHVTAALIVEQAERLARRDGELETLSSRTDAVFEILTAMLTVMTPAQRYAVWVGLNGENAYVPGLGYCNVQPGT